MTKKLLTTTENHTKINLNQIYKQLGCPNQIYTLETAKLYNWKTYGK